MDNLERLVSAKATKVDRWSSVGVAQQALENADTEVEAKVKWSKIYRLFGATGETQQDEVFAAVNMYFLLNGASPSGRYAKDIRTAGGLEASAGEVVKITGRQEGEIRQFLRGRLEDSYTFLKHNPVVANSEDLAARADAAGVLRSQAWLTADWFGRTCPYFVGDEADVYARLRASKIATARAKVKSDAGMPATDAVIDASPEFRRQPSSQNQHYNNDLF